MRLALLAVLAVLATGVLWFAGEQHRENCETSGKVSCSVLPWDRGETDPCPAYFDTARPDPDSIDPDCIDVEELKRRLRD